MAQPTDIFDNGSTAHTDGNMRRTQVRNAPNTPEQFAWDTATMQDTVESYSYFIERYPESPYVTQARERIAWLNSAGRAPQSQPYAAPSGTQGRTSAVNEDLGPLASIYNDIDALRAFVNNEPEGHYARMARRRINTLRLEQRNAGIGYLTQRINAISSDQLVADKNGKVYDLIMEMLNNGRLNIRDLLNAIATNHNFIHSETLSRLVNEGIIDIDTLDTMGIDRRFVWALADNSRSENFSSPGTIDTINKVSTEIYFWGIPSSGKSCALGAILSVANSGTVANVMEMDNDCQGYGYMRRLSGLFRTDGSVGTLPGSTPVTATYEMAFDLYDDRRRVHPITCIDLAGEIIRCMYKNDAGESLSADEAQALDTVTRILTDRRTKNRKMHFFVLEYGGEDRVYEGLRQADYLDGALQYIRRTNIFHKDTDAIFIIITKVDKTGLLGAQLAQELKNYIDSNYRGFYNGLQQICRDNEINGGTIERIPFSLGEVCFQNYCLFNPKPASKVVEIILNRSSSFSTGKKGLFEKIFKG